MKRTLTAKKLNQVSSEKEAIEIIATSSQINNKIGENNDTYVGISLYDKDIIMDMDVVAVHYFAEYQVWIQIIAEL